ncbi:DUF2141 domain-containing protein [Flavobacterium piscinae]|uniref:DUF2141 domain-containing protein n=2 Tax=Flavobacterium piscinae TaxID=2506424 RepID=A0A4Q1KPH6_9FLAO|nr:DUF2141 domain-containing protein [Flavobacterium piscinae]RXR31878.1 DUF2141 domain-containing protein [Flavobacterium piscinae]
MMIICFSCGLLAQSKLTVNIKGLKNNKGQVVVGLYQGEKNFLRKVYFGKVVSISNKEAVVEFDHLPSGEFAISLFHDENGNGKLETGWFGIPKEDYACSNGAKGFMGPPKYSDAKFTINQNKTINIKI